jgi:hypothetical protein
MAKRLSREEKIQQAVVDLLNEMFKIAGHQITYDDIKDRKDNWFQEYTMTEAQHDEWMEWGANYFKKKLSVPAYRAEKEMMWVSLMWGLKIYPSPYNTENNE